ncbi:MAG: tyrosine-protein phosphatase [Gammaproteobacteria bacterium]
MLTGPARSAARSAAHSAANAAARKSEWAEAIDERANLYRVSPTLLRSARLRKSDVSRLQALGVKTVVNLRAFHADSALLAGSGIKAVRVPINTWAISDRKVAAALKAIRTAEQDGVVLLHCQHGADRTGLVSAMYRILFQGRSKADAWEELKHGGYGYHSMWRNIETYLRVVDLDAVRALIEEA